MAYQDFKYRGISWYLFPMTFLVLLFIQFQKYKGIQLGEFVLINLTILGLQLVILSLYFSLKDGKLNFIIDSKIGLGDILLLLILCLAFSPLNFILFITLSLLAGLFITGISQLFIKKDKPLIPLASYLSIAYILVLALEYLNIIEPYQSILLSNNM